MDRVVNDLKAVRRQGAKAVIFSDDNITYDVEHFRRVCQTIVQHGLNDVCYMTQVTAAGIAKHPEVVADMDRANFRIVFVGFESMIELALRSMKKPTSPELNRRAAELLRKHRMGIVAGCTVGYPEDTAESVRRQYRMLRELGADSIYAQYLTPYPHTVLREELLAEGLLTNPDDYRTYDGFTCNVRTRHMSQDELYRSLKREIIRRSLDLSQLSSNYFLRNYTRHTAGIVLKTAAMHLYNFLFARRYPAELDV